MGMSSYHFVGGMLIILNGCVIREYCLKFVLLYDLHRSDLALCVIEIKNCVGIVTEVVSLFRCVVRRVKFNGLSIEIRCFFKLLQNHSKHHSSLHQSKFILISLNQLNEQKTILGKSGKHVQWSTYATNMNFHHFPGLNDYKFLLHKNVLRSLFLLPRKCVDLAEIIYNHCWSSIPKTDLHLWLLVKYRHC
ncbi:hypothetical protein PR048_030087 [Dryococelus australis]|uniref:Maturase K n=1 Tax=Dryococelus australis TaxID=614101 RepID=A0ABQ9G7Y3_9NEOP|nr:hypothetical protein PR048_030087 [Dryococelus australis]